MTAQDDAQTAASHPTWVRGLKLDVSEEVRSDDKVAPYVGAWIETSLIV